MQAEKTSKAFDVEEKTTWQFHVNQSSLSDLNVQTPIAGGFRFHWPYCWTEERHIDKSLLNFLAQDTQNWLKNKLGTHDLSTQFINDVTSFSYFTLVSTWKKSDLNKGTEHLYYTKLLQNAKFLVTFYMMDDICESRIPSVDHKTFVEEIAQSCYKIFMLQYENEEDVLSDLSKCKTDLKLPFNARRQLLWYDLAQQLKTEYGYSCDQTKYLARDVHRTWDHHTWLGTGDYSHTFVPEDQRYFRAHTGGGTTLFEYIMLLEGVHVSELARERKYWIRFRQDIGILIHSVNDIFSYLKENRDKAVDNEIIALLRCGIDINDSIKIVTDGHDKALKSVKDIWSYVSSIGEANEPDSLNSGLQEGIEAGIHFVSHFIQGMQYMERYTTFDYKLVHNV